MPITLLKYYFLYIYTTLVHHCKIIYGQYTSHKKHLTLIQLVLPEHTIDISWLFFAKAEDEGRTEDPTEQRKKKEHDKGRFPKSQDIPSALIVTGVIIVMFFLSAWIIEQFSELSHRFIGGFTKLPPLNTNTIRILGIQVLSKTILILSPILAISVLIGIIANIIQVGFVFSLKPLEPDFSRIKLSFKNLLQRVVFSRQILATFIKSILKTILLVVCAYLLIKNDFMTLLKLGDLSVTESLVTLGNVAFRLTLTFCIILLLFSIPDYFYQRFEFMENLKMTKEEVKQEYKESEGDPFMKQRQRQRARETTRRNLPSKIKEAEVIITNPTHVAIAIKYDPERYSAPFVLAKGQDHLALYIKIIAKREKIPIIENKPLARELHATIDEGEEIPYRFFQALADVFISIESLREKFIKTT